MYTLTLLICCTGFFCLYNTSGRARLSKHGQVQAWLQTNQSAARLLGLSAVLATLISLIVLDGAVMGVVHFLLMVMTAGCYIVGFAPFGLFRRHHILALGVVSVLLELLIF